ncbi:SCP2 sterol-binding domain-containing protein [Paenibacillus ehimensis]|uniref:SCP2 sterol-binding domain-containing protein n=1 Tax=Paenibacillus ehimensis TaxID=79264 RepID=A0ABT8VE37_9BACL|nr:SCP2 sterol-binding domain-containing protein [Paenibacillus ehimensis]MDO3679242.1 SCP2 sterol-binding domain-containing protein [Paenibacillus ehimensis]MEC0207866.1 SCP2 sterol-binding domain-containing protein [Paenibacillus ehimensis]
MAIRDDIERLVARMNANPGPIRTLNAVYQFDFGEGRLLQVRFHGGQAELADGAPYAADCKLTLSEATLLRLMRKQVNAMQVYTAGELKVEGRLTAAFRLQEVLKAYPSL